VQADALLHDGGVGLAAQRVHAGEDVREVLRQVVGPQQLAVVPAVAAAVAAGHD